MLRARAYSSWLQDAYVPKDPNTGKQAHRGFGFVTFASAEDVDKVMACAHTLHGQELAVQCAIPKVLFSLTCHQL